MVQGLMAGTVRMVLLQFNFSNILRMPNGIPQKAREKTSGYVARKSQVKGTQCLQSTMAVGGLQFLDDLAEAGYVLVDAFTQVRDRDRQTIGVARFTFVTAAHDESTPEWRAQRPAAMEILRTLFAEATWQCQAFLNHLFVEDRIIDGQFCISVNCNGRQQGGKPAGHLRISGDDLRVVNAQPN